LIRRCKVVGGATIEYFDTPHVDPRVTRITVKIDGKKTGQIINAKGGGYCYKPFNSKFKGQPFATVLEVQQDVEGD